MKVFNGWRYKRKFKKEADLRKIYRKDYAKKLHEKVVEFDKNKEIYKQEFLKDKDIYIIECNKEKDNLHEHYKKEIETVRFQTDTKWKELLNERDVEIDKLRKEKESNREFLNKFAKMVQDFELTYTTTRIELEGAGEYMQKAQQKLLRGPGEWESFTATYKKEFPKIQERLKEE
jgi:hypothetical protein